MLLLDVALEDGTGFDLLDRFPEPGFRVIFTTAFDDFALRAFRYSAQYYITVLGTKSGTKRCRQTGKVINDTMLNTYSTPITRIAISTTF